MKVTAAEARANALRDEVYLCPKVGVEIGVYKARMSSLLLRDPCFFMYLVDPWREAPEGDSYRTTDDFMSRLNQEQHEQVYQTAMEAIAPYKGRYEVMRMTSVEAAEHFKNGSLDFVFIDGDHSYDGCYTDIRVWLPKVRKRGILGGHDYREEANFGVVKAVKEAFPKGVRLGYNYTWFVTV